MCFILFITIELYLGDTQCARKLLQNELTMLRQWKTLSDDNLASTTERSIVTERIGPMLTRFWLQLRFEPKSEASSTLGPASSIFVTSAGQDSAVHIRNVDHARKELQHILETTFSTLHFYASIREIANLYEAIQNGKLMLHSWKAQFLTIVESTQATEMRNILLLEIQYQVAELILRTVVSTRDLPTIEEFINLVDLCERFLQLHLHDRASGFLMDHAVIPGLFYTAVCCPHVAISERALQLLESNEWQEGFWSSRHVGNVARTLREEEGTRPNSNHPPHLSAPESGRMLNIERLHNFEGCAWEFLGGSKLIITAPSTLARFGVADVIDDSSPSSTGTDASHD